MSDDAPKQLADHSAEVNAKVPQLVAAAKASPGTLNATLESLLALEKKTRLAADIGSSKVVALSILNLLNALQKWAVLNDHIRLLCNRRAQLKPVIQSVIQTGVTFVDGVPNNAIKTELINTLREVRFPGNQFGAHFDIPLRRHAPHSSIATTFDDVAYWHPLLTSSSTCRCPRGRSLSSWSVLV